MVADDKCDVRLCSRRPLSDTGLRSQIPDISRNLLCNRREAAIAACVDCPQNDTGSIDPQAVAESKLKVTKFVRLAASP